MFRGGKRRRTGHLDVFVAESPALCTRVALVVPKHGRKIVERNRLRRRLREGVRIELLPRCSGGELTLDLVIRPRPLAYDAEYRVLLAEIREVAERLCSPGSS